MTNSETDTASGDDFDVAFFDAREHELILTIDKDGVVGTIVNEQRTAQEIVYMLVVAAAQIARAAGDDAAVITCPKCGATSHHPTDKAQGYCANCHEWTSAPEPTI